MTSFLAFVETIAEAEQAVDGGADAVALTPGTVLGGADLAATIAGRAALCKWAGSPSGHGATGTHAGEADVLLVPSRSVLSPERAGGDRVPRPTVVVFDGACPSADNLDAIAGASHAGVMLGSPGRLLDAVSLPDLATFRDACHGRGLLCGFSGGLEPPDVPRLLALGPDVLAFRRALRPWRGSGGEGFDPQAVRLIRDLIPLAPHPVLAGRLSRPLRQAEPAARPSSAEGATRIFVRDLVIDMAIGAYASEYGRTQRVRFGVEADLDGVAGPAQERRDQDMRDQDMRDVVSYDLLSDAIRQVAARPHVEFVETLAEAIAARVLAHRRVRAVKITVEKLDLGPGSVGIEISRNRAATTG